MAWSISVLQSEPVGGNGISHGQNITMGPGHDHEVEGCSLGMLAVRLSMALYQTKDWPCLLVMSRFTLLRRVCS